MKVYFSKENVNEYVIVPEPEDKEKYYEINVDEDVNLDNKRLVEKNGKMLLVDKPQNDFYEWDGVGWVMSNEKMTALLANKRDSLIEQIDNHAATIYSQWTRFESEYRERQAAAETYKSANYQGECNRYITDFAQRAGLDNKAATNLILMQAAGLEKLQVELANQRMRKYELKRPNLKLEQLQSIYDDIIKQMDLLMEAYQNG